MHDQATEFATDATDATAGPTWLDNGIVTVRDLMSVSRLSEAELDELIAYGGLPPVREIDGERVFSAALVVPLRTAVNLRRVYDLDIFAVALVLEYLQRIEDLQTQVQSLEARQVPGA